MITADRIQATGNPDERLVQSEFTLTRRDLHDIAGMIYADAGITLHEGKASLVYSRLTKRLRAVGLNNFRDYCQLVSSPEGAAERREMLSSLTTNFTKFFREKHHFDHLSQRLATDLAPKARAGGRVRIWSAGCSDGSEPYSIALTCLAALPEAASLDFKILATDIDPNILAKAKAGTYDAHALEALEAGMRNRMFSDLGGGSLRIRDEARELITFRELNLLSSWPFRGPFDIIFCRNVVIYFDEATQVRIWQRYAEMLAPGGYLYIGHSERVAGPAKDKFTADGITTYRKADKGVHS